MNDLYKIKEIEFNRWLESAMYELEKHLDNYAMPVDICRGFYQSIGMSDLGKPSDKYKNIPYTVDQKDQIKRSVLAIADGYQKAFMQWLEISINLLNTEYFYGEKNDGLQGSSWEDKI